MQPDSDVGLDGPPKFPEERHDLKCGECGERMVLRESKKFPDRPFYGCSTWPKCDGTHGAHVSGAPLGVPANKATKQARIRAHEVFDRLWKSKVSKRKARRDAYKWMRDAMGLSKSEAHIGRLSEEQCEKLIRALYRDHPHLHNGFSRLLYGEFDE